jgi:putative Ca2+/H+ antiporter (TMEM165/GDT1 family)
MSFFADREMILSALTLGIVSVAIGFIIRFTRHGPLDHVYAYLFVAVGVILLFAASLARKSPSNARMLRYLLAGLTVLLLAGLLFMDAIATLV